MEKIPAQTQSDLIRVVLFGPESTGKTTLSRQLAEHYQTQWVPEFAREYLQKKWDTEQKICEPKDILPIAIGQMQLENQQLEHAKDILITDTDLLETKVYAKVYYQGFVPQELDAAIKGQHYDLYLLTYIDTPWVADDLRDKPNERLQMFTHFETALQEHQKHYILLKGDQQTRFSKATAAIDSLLKKRTQNQESNDI